MSLLFFAIVPPLRELEMIRKTVLPVLERHTKDWKTANPEQWHITIHFCGYVSPLAEEKIIESFQQLKMPRAEKIIIGGNPSTALMPHPDIGRIFHARVTDEQLFLSNLRTIIRSIAPVSERPTILFHLTLARARKNGTRDSAIISEIPPFTSTFLPGGVTLFRSHQQNGKTIHIPLVTRAFSL